ncbi:MAG: hypothetical protein Kow0096_09580 [Thiohalomonadaceae bacterium]
MFQCRVNLRQRPAQRQWHHVFHRLPFRAERQRLQPGAQEAFFVDRLGTVAVQQVAEIVDTHGERMIAGNLRALLSLLPTPPESV